MKSSRTIALSAVSAAMAVLLLVAGAYIEVLDLSCLFLASLALMLPLAKGSRFGSFFAFLASAILGFILSGMRLQIMLPYVLFFGLHPVVNDFFEKKNVNAVLSYAIKAVWFIAAIFVVYKFTSFFVVENETIKKYIVPIIIIGGAALFLLYDSVMRRMQKYLNALISRLKI